MFRCSMCGQKFCKGTVDIEHKIQNHNLAKTAMIFRDKMDRFKKEHPVHICSTYKDRIVLQSGFGEFVGLKLEEDERLE